MIFVYYSQFYRRKTVGFSQLRTWIVKVEGKHADHLTIIAALHISIGSIIFQKLSVEEASISTMNSFIDR